MHSKKQHFYFYEDDDIKDDTLFESLCINL